MRSPAHGNGSNKEEKLGITAITSVYYQAEGAIRSIGGEKRKVVLSAPSAEIEWLGDDGLERIDQIHRRHSRGSSVVRNVKKSRRDRVEIFRTAAGRTKNTTRCLTFRKAAEIPISSEISVEVLWRGAAVPFLYCSISVKNIEDKSQSWAAWPEQRSFAGHDGSSTSLFHGWRAGWLGRGRRRGSAKRGR